MAQRVLVINPGSTTTKIAVFEGAERLIDRSLDHSAKTLAAYPVIASQQGFRDRAIREILKDEGFDPGTLSAVIGRGGLLRPVPGGVYTVDAGMLAELSEARNGEHASNLGALIASGFASELGIPAYIADPVVVDELSDLARVSGHRHFRRTSVFHALNQKAVARRHCDSAGIRYEDAVLIVAHMGGGVSVGLHRGGRVEDVNQALDGEGPFSPERSGTLPTGQLVRLCFSGAHTQQEIRRMLTGAGGLVSFIGTNDMREAERRARSGDSEAGLYFRAFAYQVGKAIGALAAAACGKVDAILLTGGIAGSEATVKSIAGMVSFIAPVHAYPGEGEMEALAQAALGALDGSRPVLSYASAGRAANADTEKTDTKEA